MGQYIWVSTARARQAAGAGTPIRSAIAQASAMRHPRATTAPWQWRILASFEKGFEKDYIVEVYYLFQNRVAMMMSYNEHASDLIVWFVHCQLDGAEPSAPCAANA
mgnify:CR=1 FL=1